MKNIWHFGKFFSIYIYIYIYKNLYLTSKANVKIDDQYTESFNIMKGVRQVFVHYHQFFSIYLLITFLNDFSELGIPLGESRLLWWTLCR